MCLQFNKVQPVSRNNVLPFICFLFFSPHLESDGWPSKHRSPFSNCCCWSALVELYTLCNILPATTSSYLWHTYGNSQKSISVCLCQYEKGNVPESQNWFQGNGNQAKSRPQLYMFFLFFMIFYKKKNICHLIGSISSASMQSRLTGSNSNKVP